MSFLFEKILKPGIMVGNNQKTCGVSKTILRSHKVPHKKVQNTSCVVFKHELVKLECITIFNENELHIMYTYIHLINIFKK